VPPAVHAFCTWKTRCAFTLNLHRICTRPGHDVHIRNVVSPTHRTCFAHNKHIVHFTQNLHRICTRPGHNFHIENNMCPQLYMRFAHVKHVAHSHSICAEFAPDRDTLFTSEMLCLQHPERVLRTTNTLCILHRICTDFATDRDTIFTSSIICAPSCTCVLHMENALRIHTEFAPNLHPTGTRFSHQK
jgi:hypothetical protein